MGREEGCFSRRAVLGTAAAGVAAAGLAGCGGTDWYPSDVTPDEHMLRSLIREKERMVVRYERAVENGAGPEDLLDRFLTDHRTHVDSLVQALPEDVEPSPPVEEGEAEPVGPDEDPDLDEPVDTAGLRTLEAAATNARLDQAAAVTDHGLAQLICGIGACEAGHTHLLGES